MEETEERDSGEIEKESRHATFELQLRIVHEWHNYFLEKDSITEYVSSCAKYMCDYAAVQWVIKKDS